MEERGVYEYGFLAQELEKLLPELVGYDTNGQYLMVAYYQMIPILVTAIKEQQSIIKNQDTLIINQEKRLDEIEKKLNIIISNE